jgi:hypothetical protein
MIKEEVIVQSLSITRKGERVYFQIPLPYDTKRVIGLEYGYIKKAVEQIVSRRSGDGIGFYPMTIFSNKVIGKLSLSCSGHEGLFYQGDLSENRNVFMNEQVVAVVFSPFEWTHFSKKEEITFCVDGCTRVIEGYFEDSFAEEIFTRFEYVLNLYLWIEKNIA